MNQLRFPVVFEKKVKFLLQNSEIENENVDCEVCKKNTER